MISHSRLIGNALRTGALRVVPKREPRNTNGRKMDTCHARRGKKYKKDELSQKRNPDLTGMGSGNYQHYEYLVGLGLIGHRGKLFITDSERAVIADRLAKFERTRGSVEHITSPLKMLRNRDGESDASTDSLVLRRIDRRETDAMAEEIAGIIAGATPDAKFLESEIDDERIRMTCKRFGLAQPTFERIDRSRLKSERAKQAKRKPKRKSRPKRAIETTSA